MIINQPTYNSCLSVFTREKQQNNIVKIDASTKVTQLSWLDEVKTV